MFRTYLFPLILLFTVVLAGCAADKTLRRPLFLEPAPIPKKAEDLKVSPGGELILETPDVRFRLSPLRSVRTSDPRLIQALVAEGFVIIDMEIINMTENDKVMFNPSMSALMSNKSEYKKPLEYTALFSVAMHRNMERTLNRELKGRFYDSNEIIRAGEKTRKFLIFTPFTKKGKKAMLIFQEVYIGNKTIRITFPFLITGVE